MYNPISNFDEAAEKILAFMNYVIPINTIFIAKNDKQINRIEKVVNKEQDLLHSGDALPFDDTYCKLSIDHGDQVLVINDLNHNQLTKDMNVTHNLGGGSFIGIPINYSSGENYGTICGLDDQQFDFTAEHLEHFRTMASLLSYVLDLDRANKEIERLSAPLVVLSQGIAILPIIGNINENRANYIISSTLTQSTSQYITNILIDLSGIHNIDTLVTHFIFKLVSTLKLLGITPIIIGIKPDHAKVLAGTNQLTSDILVKSKIEDALTHLGFTISTT
ncbi:STAS domain-containing protein [Bacillus sp. ISL-39]|uniref:STAS domain-containing protein n=1 Tax=Bacillus sp. ISL-39 TaxID=2819124 RepID=UPI002035F0E0|nr:STAS domain-containing protein [Bacillus sp. ISL-39]